MKKGGAQRGREGGRSGRAERSAGGARRRRAGRNAGHNAGRNAGHNAGRNAGHKAGRDAGRQEELPFPPGRGGKRAGAGRKPRGARAGVAHRPRARIGRKTPVHVTVRLVPEVGSLRRFKLVPAMRKAFAGGAAAREGFRLCQFSIQRNHLHLACEADSNEALARGMQGFEIRFARRVNRKLDRKGKVFADRFHAVPVRSPRHLRNTLCYVMNNARRHGERLDPSYNGVDPFSSAWWFDGWSDERWRRGLDPPPEGPCVAEPEGWLMTTGWRRYGPIGVTEVPPAARSLFPSREQWLGMDE